MLYKAYDKKEHYYSRLLSFTLYHLWWLYQIRSHLRLRLSCHPIWHSHSRNTRQRNDLLCNIPYVSHFLYPNNTYCNFILTVWITSLSFIRIYSLHTLLITSYCISHNLSPQSCFIALYCECLYTLHFIKKKYIQHFCTASINIYFIYCFRSSDAMSWRCNRIPDTIIKDLKYTPERSGGGGRKGRVTDSLEQSSENLG